VLVPLVYPALAALFLWDVVFTGRAYLLRDILTFFHPWQTAVRESLRAGALPFWNHATYCGLPLLANLQSGFFYPMNWLYWFLPFDAALTAGMVLHLAVAGIFLRGFLRRAGLADPAALVGGALFAFGTWPLAHLEAPMKLGAAAWLPLAWCGAWDAMRDGKRQGIGLAALATALSLLAGYPQITALGLLSVALLALFLAGWVICAKGIRGVEKLHRLIALPVAGVVGVLVAAAQLAPAWEMMNQSGKVTTYPPDVAFSRSMPPKGLVGLVDPFFLGFPGVDRYWGGEAVEYPYGAIYVGALAIVLVAASIPALRGVRRPRRVRREDMGKPIEEPLVARIVPPFLILGAVLGVLLTLGRHGPLWPLFHAYVPGFAGFRWPATAAFLAGVHLAALAAIGLAWCARDAARWRVPSFAALGLGAVLSAIALLARGPLADAFGALQLAGSPEYQHVAWDSTHGAWIASLAIRGTMLIAAGVIGVVLARIPGVVAWTWAGLLLVDLFLAHRAADTPSAKNFYDSIAPETVALREELRGRRIFTPRETDQLGNFLAGSRNPVAFEWAKRAMLCNANVAAGISQVQGCDPLSPRRHDAFAQAFDAPGTPHEIRERLFDLWDAARLVEVSVGPLDVPALEDPMLGVTLNPHEPAIGRATLVSGWEVPGDGPQVLRRLLAPDHDPRTVVLLEPTPGGPEVATGARLPTRKSEAIEYETFPNRMRVAWHVGEGGMLRVLESWAPGWRARVNGQPAPIYRADFLFMAVPVPAGSVVAEFEYRPAMFLPGVAASAVGLILLVACLTRSRRRVEVVAERPRAAAPVPRVAAPREPQVRILRSR
jgi:hypothetical protein